jgi:hypothetical protein
MHETITTRKDYSENDKIQFYIQNKTGIEG